MARTSTPGHGGGGGRSRPGRRELMRAAAGRPARALRHLRDAIRRSKHAAAVFVSYARDDGAVVEELVANLRARGVAVTWDQDIAGGTDFEQAIRKAIDAAPAVIVVWSPVSVRSAFVRDEAKRGMLAGKLVTTHTDGFDFADVPLGFGQLNAIPVGDRARLARTLACHGVHLAADR